MEVAPQQGSLAIHVQDDGAAFPRELLGQTVRLSLWSQETAWHPHSGPRQPNGGLVEHLPSLLPPPHSFPQLACRGRGLPPMPLTTKQPNLLVANTEGGWR